MVIGNLIHSAWKAGMISLISTLISRSISEASCLFKSHCLSGLAVSSMLGHIPLPHTTTTARVGGLLFYIPLWPRLPIPSHLPGSSFWSSILRYAQRSSRVCL